VLDEESSPSMLLKSKRLTFKYSMRCKRYINEYFPCMKEGKVIFALPMDLEYQTFISIETDCHKYRLIKDPPYNDVEFDFSDGFPELLKFILVVDVKVIQHQRDPTKDLEKVTDPNDHLYEYATFCDDHFDWKNPDFIKKCEEITKPGKTLYEKVVLFVKYNEQHYLHNNNNPAFNKEVSPGIIEHNYSAEPVYTKISDILKSMKGHCRDCSEMFVGMVRTLGVPCRVVSGSTAEYSAKNIGHDHFAVEVYDAPMKKWFYIEPQGGVWFGLNANYHILFGDFRNQKKYPNNFCFLNGMRYIDANLWGNKTALTFESKTLSLY